MISKAECIRLVLSEQSSPKASVQDFQPGGRYCLFLFSLGLFHKVSLLESCETEKNRLLPLNSLLTGREVRLTMGVLLGSKGENLASPCH